MVTQEQLKEKIIAGLGLEDIGIDEIEDDMPLFGDDGLGLDSVDAIELTLIIEKEFGVKIKDFELIGIPYAVVIGNDINQGKVELITRDGLIKEELTTETLLETILEKLI